MGIGGTLGGIADQAAGPAAAAALKDHAELGQQAPASRSPPSLPTKLQLATMLANQEASEKASTNAFRKGDQDGRAFVL